MDLMFRLTLICLLIGWLLMMGIVLVAGGAIQL